MIVLKFNQAAQDYLLNSVYNEIKRRIEDVLSDKKINRGTEKKRNKLNVTLSKQLEKYLCTLLVDNNLNRLILGNPKFLQNEIKKIEKDVPKGICRNKNGNKPFDHIILTSIFLDFGYGNQNFDKKTFIDLLEIETCPYCNRSYIYTLDKDKKIKPEIDHFYPKTIYPFLAASFYNLIPSCQTCNGLSVKGAIDTFNEDVVNPYLINHDQFKFTYDLKSMSLFNPISTKGSIKVRFVKRIKENDDLFKLSELYEKHEDHVLELIIKSQLQYSESYRKYLKKYKRLNFSDSEIDRLITGNYTRSEERRVGKECPM
jgi:hypothetical protein